MITISGGDHDEGIRIRAAKTGTRQQHQGDGDDVADIHRGDQAPDEILLVDEQHRPGIEAPDHQAAHHDRCGRRAGNAEREHRQQALVPAA